MRQILMQDWITVRGTAGQNVTQAESAWIWTGPYQDMYFVVEVREVGVAITLNIETCPTRDEVMFQAAASPLLRLASPPPPIFYRRIPQRQLPSGHGGEYWATPETLGM